MVLTGYEFTYKDTTVGLCPTHRKELGVPVSDCSAPFKPGTYRYGCGSSPCAVCGFDVRHPLSPQAISPHDDTPRDSVVVEEREPLSLDIAAELITYAQNIDGMAFIELGPGGTPEEVSALTTDDGTVVAAQLEHGDDAAETLHVKLLNYNADYTYVEMHERARRVALLLRSFGLRSTVTPHPHGDMDYWRVIAPEP